MKCFNRDTSFDGFSNSYQNNFITGPSNDSYNPKEHENSRLSTQKDESSHINSRIRQDPSLKHES